MSGMWVTRLDPGSAEGLDHTAQESHLHGDVPGPSWLLKDNSILALGERRPVLSFLSQLPRGTWSWVASFSSLQAGRYPETQQPSQSQGESWRPSGDQGGHNLARALMAAGGPGSPGSHGPRGGAGERGARYMPRAPGLVVEGRWAVRDGASEVGQLMRFAHQPSWLFLWRWRLCPGCPFLLSAAPPTPALPGQSEQGRHRPRLLAL